MGKGLNHIMSDVIILGAGIAGLTAGYYLQQFGESAIVVEKEDTYGGLCNSFEIDGFTFDTFAHISFDNDKTTYDMLEGKTSHWVHQSEATNYYNGLWVRNPVQNNLIGLPVEERIKIIKGFTDRKSNDRIETYADWLKAMFGDYFAQNYPYKYTRKYWTVEPDKLESKWINGRMYTPTLEEILRGAMEKEPHTTHYSKEARYPKYGGFKAFLNPLAQNCNIKYNMNIVEIDTKKKMIKFENGEEWKYSNLISTIPLTELCHMIKDTPHDIIAEVEKLDYTSGVMLSLGLNKPCTSPTLWFYIYDEDILPARVYAPNIKSVNNVPKGCSSIQAEIYYSKYKKIPDDLEKLKEDVITQLLKLGLFKRDDIIVSDIRMKQYANIMFTPQIYSARDIIHNYLRSVDVEYAGRWGEWDYLWVGQSYRSGRAVAERCLKNSKWRK